MLCWSGSGEVCAALTGDMLLVAQVNRLYVTGHVLCCCADTTLWDLSQVWHSTSYPASVHEPCSCSCAYSQSGRTKKTFCFWSPVDPFSCQNWIFFFCPAYLLYLLIQVREHLISSQFFLNVRPHKVNSLLLVPRPRWFGGKIKKKKKKRVGVFFDQTATARMNKGVKRVTFFRIVADGNTSLPYYALPAERSKTFANAVEDSSSADRDDSSASFDASTVVPKAVEKVVVKVQKHPKSTAVQITVAATFCHS